MADVQLDTQDAFAKVWSRPCSRSRSRRSRPTPTRASCSTSPARPRKLLIAGGTSRPPPETGSPRAAAAYYNAVWRNLPRLLFDDELPTGLKADGDARWRSAVQRLLTNPEGAIVGRELRPQRDRRPRRGAQPGPGRRPAQGLTRSSSARTPTEVAVGQAGPAHAASTSVLGRRHGAGCGAPGWSTSTMPVPGSST